MLSTFNLPSNNIDPNRQMAMMRTYLSQLKDELETELYNIGWNNLTNELREKISSLEAYRGESDEKVNMIRANMVTTEYLSANYATITNLDAVSASIDSLSAIAITTNNLSAQTIYGNQITGLTINANQITSGKITSSQLNASDIASNLFVGEALVAAATAFTSCNSKYFRASSAFSVGGSGRVTFYNSDESDSVYLDYSRVKTILQSI